CASFLIYSYCPNAIDRTEVVKLGNMLLSEMGNAHKEIYQTIKKSQYDLLTQVTDVSLASAAEIESKIELINQSIILIQNEINAINSRISNVEGFFANSLQEQIISSSLMSGIHQSQIQALELKQTYEKYHQFIAAIITCSLHVQPDCGNL